MGYALRLGSFWAWIFFAAIAAAPAATLSAPPATPLAAAPATMSPSPPAQAAVQGPLQVQDVRGQTIVFSGNGAPKPLKTRLFDLNYVGTLKPHDDSTPYFLFAADPCDDCSTERALYLIRPQLGPTPEGKPRITQFVYPGRIIDPRTRTMVLESRAFYGHCLSASRRGRGNDPGDDVYIVFQKERVKQRHRRTRLLSSVYIAHASSDFLRDQLMERHLPSLRRTLALVRAKKCHEIDGRYRLMELKPRGLDWRKLQPDNPDEDQDQDDSSSYSPPQGALPRSESPG